MIDLHCHILPEVDDGAASLEEALAMARFCVRDGITHITATPHCHRHIHLLRSDILPHVAAFNEELARERVPLTILPGSEIRLTSSAEYRREFELFCHLGDGRAFTLLEFDWKEQHYPADAPELVRWLRGQGMTPIIAHPERQSFLCDEPERLGRLVDAGAWLQLTVDSLLGNHGPGPWAAGERLLKEYTDIVLSTDAHNLRRCSGLSAGYTLVRERFGAPREDELRARSDQVLAALIKASERTG